VRIDRFNGDRDVIEYEYEYNWDGGNILLNDLGSGEMK
jgi:hypothetical protein